MVGNEKYPRQRNSWRSELDTGHNCIVTTQIAFHDSNRGLGAPNVFPYFGFVNADHDFWIEHRQQSFEVSLVASEKGQRAFAVARAPLVLLNIAMALFSCSGLSFCLWCEQRGATVVDQRTPSDGLTVDLPA
jgi:hypothetical protein